MNLSAKGINPEHQMRIIIMYTVIGLNYGETSVITNCTNLKNLDRALRVMEEQFEENKQDDFKIDDKLPTYSELLKIFKNRKNTSKITEKVYWLECLRNDSDYTIVIEYTEENKLFNF